MQDVFCNWNDQHSIYPLEAASWDCCDITVNRVSEIDLNGTPSIQQFCGQYGKDIYACIEGVGIVTSGFLPFIDCHVNTTGGECSEYNLNCLYDANGKRIYKADNYVDVTNVKELSGISTPTVNLAIERTGDGIEAEGAEITLYDLSGRAVASGYESLSTTSLQPGVYIAKAQSSSGISTLKIRID